MDLNKPNTFKECCSFLCSKKIIIRDTILVLTVLIFTIAWAILTFVFNINLFPDSGAEALDYFVVFFYPMIVCLLGNLLYRILSVIDVIRGVYANIGTKVLFCICVWFVVGHLFYLFYIVKLVFFINSKKATT